MGGLLVFDSDNSVPDFYSGVAWRRFVHVAVATLTAGCIPFSESGSGLIDDVNLDWDNVTKTLSTQNFIATGKLITDGTTTTAGPGAVAVTGSIHEITTTGTGDALTLANGTEGQRLHVVYVAEAAGGDTAILTPTSLAGADTIITFNDLGDTVDLLFTAGAWYGVGVKDSVFS